MKIQKTEVKRNPWTDEAIVSRRQNGRWIITCGGHGMETPAATFATWDQATWTANAWANELLEKKLAGL